MNDIGDKLRKPNMSSEESHMNWMRMKEKQGWVYGETKDFDKKTHPDLVPYADLPTIEKSKDFAGGVSNRLALILWEELTDK